MSKSPRIDVIMKREAKYAAAHPSAPASKLAQYRRELERPSRIVLRGNAVRAKELGRPLDYDRVGSTDHRCLRAQSPGGRKYLEKLIDQRGHYRSI